MYVLGSKLHNVPVLSLQDGSIIARVEEVLIDPATLEIAAFKCAEDRHLPENPLVLPQDVRQFSPDGLIMNFLDDITSSADVIRLSKLIARPYHLIGAKVISDMHRKLGRVEDYTVNTESFRIQRLYVKRSLIRSPLGSSLIIDRTQVLDVTEREIVVREATIHETALAPRAVPKINP